jgi:protein phosphatase
MNLIRRIFNQPDADEAHSASVPGETSDAIHLPASNDHPSPPSPAEMRINIADGVTRPLPQEPLTTTSGNEHIIFGQASDVGMVRTNNQDAALAFFSTSRSADESPDFGLFIVADGMGGHHDGEKASALTARTIASEIINRIYLSMLLGTPNNEVPISEALEDAVQHANQAVLTKVPDGGTTLTAVTIIGDLAYIAHVGDTRVYLITRDNIEQITRDHSLVQRLIELDQLTQEEAVDHPQKNVLYRAVGQSESLEVDKLTRRLPPKSRLLLCSDGLWNQVEEHEIVDIVMRYSNPQEACEKLIAMANSRGGIDNVTAILLQIPG